MADMGEKLRDIVRGIVEDVTPVPRWGIGDIVEHPDGYPVRILSGVLWRVYADGSQRLVNRWRWQRLDAKGNPVGEPEESEGWISDPAILPPSLGH